MAKNIKQKICVVWLISGMVTLLMLWATHAFPFTYEGELDPGEFDKWKVVSVRPSPQGLLWITIQNPDLKSPIQIVAMAIYPGDTTLLGYRYFKNGKPYSYIFDAEKDKYVQKILTEQQQQGCMQCHPGKRGKYGST